MTKEELEKEAKEYAEGMAKYYASTHEDYIPSQFEKYLRNAYISSAYPREKRIADLEKENAEFKETVIKMNNVITETFRNLTTAKELLKTYKDFIEYEGLSTRLGKTYDRTVQFLKELE